jgi:hypothetical protein
MKAVKNFFAPFHVNSIEFELATTLVGALMIAWSIGIMMVMIVSRF